MQTKVKFAVLGFGRIGRRHAEIIHNHPEAELSALVDCVKPDFDLGSLREIPFFYSLEEFLESQIAVDVVVVASPNGLHAQHALQCLNAFRHVVIEKPMTLNRVDAEQIIYKALQVNKHVFVVMQNRYSPPVQWLKQTLESRILGHVYMVQMNCYWNRDHRYYQAGSWHGTAHLDGGTLFTQFSHFIDIMYWLFGDIEDIQARFADFNHGHSTDFEDSGFVNFKFVNGGMGSLNFSTSIWDQNLESSMTLIAEKGSIKIGGQYMNELEICHLKEGKKPLLAPTNPGNDYGQFKGSAANHQFVINNVIEVLNQKASITTNALEGLKVVDIIERMYQAFPRPSKRQI